jgi:hypothetical protein
LPGKNIPKHFAAVRFRLLAAFLHLIGNAVRPGIGDKGESRNNEDKKECKYKVPAFYYLFHGVGLNGLTKVFALMLQECQNNSTEERKIFP